MDKDKQAQLKQLPGVDRILAYGADGQHFDDIPKSVLIPAIRAAIDTLRANILESKQPVDNSRFSTAALVEAVKQRAAHIMALKLKRTINATGVVVHTNLGRSLLSPRVLDHLASISSRYSTII